jgi:tRNA nucleotidyltransferase (CCA-adding enzyme)
MFAASKLYPGSIMVHPGSLDINATKIVSIFEDSLKLIKIKDIPNSLKNEIKRMVIVDTKNYYRIGEGKELLLNSPEIIIFDHHPDTSVIKNTKVVSKKVGANTTIIVDLLKKKKIILNSFEATLISLGIFEDTGSFTFPSTTSDDFKAIAFLSSFGINMKIVHHFLSPFLVEEQVIMLRNLLNNLEEFNIKGSKIAIAVASMERYVPGLSLIAHKIIELIDTDIIFILAKMKRDVFIIARSVSPEYDLRPIIERFNGGGHPTAASAVLRDANIEEIKNEITRKASQSYFPVLKAKNIMSSPVKTVSPSVNIKEALKIMIKMGFSGLPIEDDGRIIGILSKRDLEKVLLFEKRERPVKQFFTPLVATVPPDADLREIEDTMIKNNIGRVLVIDKDKPMGIISRSDLLKAYRIKEDMVEISISSEESSFLPTQELVIQIMKASFDSEALSLVKEFGSIAKSVNQKIYLVGGAMRDMLLGARSCDFDLILSDDAIAFGKALNKRFNGIIKVYSETQTVNFKTDRFTFDFVTSRREYYNEKSLIPIIEKATLQEDLKRRDFTINTLAVDITPDNFGTMYDFFGGYTDLVQKRIRVLHSYSFIEDPSRVLRAIKYIVRLGFQLSDETEMLLKNAVELGAIKSKHSQRILTELMELLSREKIIDSLLLMDKYGILNQIFRIRRLGVQKIARLKRSLELIKSMKLENISMVYIAILIDGKSNSEKREILEFFSLNKRLINKFIAQWGALNEFHKHFEDLGIDEKFMLIKEVDDFILCGYLTKASIKEKRFIKYFINHLRGMKIKINGGDLIDLGLKEGPQFRKIFDNLTKLKILGKVKNRQEEVNYILLNKEKFEWK